MVRGEIVEKEFPLRDFPKLVALMPVETNHVGGDGVEFFTKIGQRLVSFDPPDHPLHPKQIDHLRETGLLIEVHADGVVTEIFADVKEVTGAAPDIEDPLFATEIETEITDARQVDFHPALDVEVFGPGIARVGHPMT